MDASTNPWLVPLSYERCAVFQSLPTPSVWHTLGIWKAWTRWPLPSGQAAFGRPAASRGNPSPRPSIPRRLSKEWFSIITTTKCSTSGTMSVPAARRGSGSEPAWRKSRGGGQQPCPGRGRLRRGSGLPRAQSQPRHPGRPRHPAAAAARTSSVRDDGSPELSCWGRALLGTGVWRVLPARYSTHRRLIIRSPDPTSRAGSARCS